MAPSQSDQEVECALLWKLARLHGWSQWVPVDDLVKAADVDDKQQARQVCESRVASKTYVNYHNGRDEIRIRVPHAALAKDLKDNCGYTKIQIETTLSHFDGF